MSVPTFRFATSTDDAAIAGVHWASRRLAYRGVVPEENLDARTPDVLTAEWREILARRDGTEHILAVLPGDAVVGFVSGGPVRPRERPVAGDLSGVTAEISLLYVAPERMGQGIGRALFGRMARHLAG